MLNKKQIINFLKIRNDTDSLGTIKNVIILSMIKYYKDMNIIDLIDSINIYNIDSKDFVVNTILNNHSIGVPNNLPLITKIEGLLLKINTIKLAEDMGLIPRTVDKVGREYIEMLIKDEI